MARTCAADIFDIFSIRNPAAIKTVLIQRDFLRQAAATLPDELQTVIAQNILKAAYNGKILLPITTVKTLQHHSYDIEAVSWSPDDQFIASSSADRTIKICSAQSGSVHKTIDAHSRVIRDIDWSPQGSDIVASCWDGTITTWDALQGKKRSVISINMKPDAIQCSPDGSMIAYTCGTRVLNIIRVATQKLLHVFCGHSAIINGIAWNPRFPLIASCSGDTTVCVWDVDQGKQVTTFTDHSSAVCAVAWSPDGLSLAAGSTGGDLIVWDTQTHKIAYEMHAHTDDIVALAWNTHNILATGSDDTSIKLWNGQTGAHITTLPGHISGINDLRWSHDGQSLASASHDETVKIWQPIQPVLTAHEWDHLTLEQALFLLLLQTYRPHYATATPLVLSELHPQLAIDEAIRIFSSFSPRTQKLLTHRYALRPHPRMCVLL